MAHPLALRRGSAGDERHRLQPRAASEQLGRVLLVAATDLADEHQVGGRGVLLEQLDHVAKRQPENRVSADAHDG